MAGGQTPLLSPGPHDVTLWRQVCGFCGGCVMAPGADHNVTEARMTKRIFGCVIVCGLLIAGGSLQAHHSLAGVYDMKAEKEIAGTLTKIQFVNPHGSMTISVKNPDGTT